MRRADVISSSKLGRHPIHHRGAEGTENSMGVFVGVLFTPSSPLCLCASVVNRMPAPSHDLQAPPPPLANGKGPM
jgi:hypothetical protein